MSNRKYSLARAHNISLPSTKRKLNIDEATSALSSMGYRMGNVRHSLADKTSYWSVTTPTGSVVEVAANKLTDFVYGKIKNLNAQRYTETTYEVLFPDEDDDTQFIDSKEAAIRVARQYAAKGCTVELSQVIKTWRSKAEADAAQIPTNTKETPMRFVKDLNMNSTGAKARFAVRHPSVSGMPIDPYATKVPILLKDKTTVNAVRVNGRWSIEGRSDMPTSRNFEQLIGELNAAGFSRVGAKAKFGEDWDLKNKDQATKIIAEIARLIPKYESRRKEIRDAISDLQTANNLAHDALARESTVALDKAFEYKQKADHARSSFSRTGAKAKFGEVENLLNMISDQMNSGNNDLAKTNLRKLAAKIGEIRHTRSEWDQFMTVAKSLGFTESQIGGFSRRGSKMAKSTYATSPLQELGNKVQRLNDQYHQLAARAEQAKSAADIAYRAYVEAKNILDAEIRSSLRNRQNSQGFSRVGAKAKFLLYGGIMDGIEKGIANRMKSAARYRAQGNDEMAKFTEDDAEDLKRIKRALVQGDGEVNHAKQIAKMIQNLDTEVRRDCGDALIEWAARKSGVTINYSRVGAKAKFVSSTNGPFRLMMPDIFPVGQRVLPQTFATVKEAMMYADKNFGGLAATVKDANHSDVAEKPYLGQWAQRFSRTGAKTTHAHINGYYKVAP